jgi:hypothetical protein
MRQPLIKRGWIALGLTLALAACQPDPGHTPPKQPPVPRGYLDRLEIQVDDRVLAFGPFVGYYFKPSSGGDLKRLDFICFNKDSFYTRDLPANTLLYTGKARWQRLPKAHTAMPGADGRRIVPLFFSQAPEAWRKARPVPQQDYLHFHSAYDGRGAVRYGYWLRHTAKARFTYDMGGRVAPDSALYHLVEPGPDRQFARIIEFDHGPGN